MYEYCLLVLFVRRIYDSTSMRNSVDSTEWWWMRLLKQARQGVVRGLSLKFKTKLSQKVEPWNQLIFILDSGSLILEMGALSRLTGDPTYESAALRALRRLWSMRSSLNLLGTTLDVVTGEWIEYSSGIGAGRYSLGFDFVFVLDSMSFGSWGYQIYKLPFLNISIYCIAKFGKHKMACCVQIAMHDGIILPLHIGHVNLDVSDVGFCLASFRGWFILWVSIEGPCSFWKWGVLENVSVCLPCSAESF